MDNLLINIPQDDRLLFPHIHIRDKILRFLEKGIIHISIRLFCTGGNIFLQFVKTSSCIIRPILFCNIFRHPHQHLTQIFLQRMLHGPDLPAFSRHIQIQKRADPGANHQKQRLISDQRKRHVLLQQIMRR